MNLPALSSTTSTPWSQNTARSQCQPRQTDSGSTSGLGDLSTLSSQLSQHVDTLNTKMTEIAQSLLEGFASDLLGDAADGASISFDSLSLSTASSLQAAYLSQQSASGSFSAAALRLEDASQFSGRGTITTADGRSFEFELEIRYSATLEMAAATQQSVADDGSGDTSSGTSTQGSDTASTGQTERSGRGRRPHDGEHDQRSERGERRGRQLGNRDFPGTAAQLFDQLSSEPVRRPFRIDSSDDSSTATNSVLGDLAMRLLGLPGGERYLDLLAGQDEGQQLDVLA